MKQDTEFRQIFKPLQALEWCSFMENNKTRTWSTRALVDVLKKICPKLVQKCPYFGRFEIVNLKFHKTMFLIYPSGVFRITGNISDDLKNVIFSVAVLIEVI